MRDDGNNITIICTESNPTLPPTTAIVNTDKTRLSPPGTPYQGQWRSKSLRLKNWDYGANGAYFITICTRNHVHCFGAIKNNHMQLLPLGVIADILWYEIKNHTTNVELAEFVVMPNHIHGILILDDSNNNHKNNTADPPPSIDRQRFQNQGKNTVSSIVGSYKSAVTRHTRRLGFDFHWQKNYWEHIIRNENEYNNIAQYIIDNPVKWANDKLNGGIGNCVMEPQPEYNNEIWMV